MKYILEVNLKKQQLRLRNSDKRFNNEKGWTSSDSFCTFDQMNVLMSKITDWDFLKIMNLLLDVKSETFFFHLHYAVINKDDVDLFKFESHESMVGFIDEKCINRSGIVYLLGREGLGDVFITDSCLRVEEILQKISLFQMQGRYFLQEYNSYEEAYKVALNLKEDNDLCYEKV